MFFVLMVVYAPGGIASLILIQLAAIRARRFGELVVPYLLAGSAALLALAGLIGIVEMVYHLSDTSSSPQMALLGIDFDARSAPPWIALGAALAAGLALLRVTARRVGDRWGAIQLELQAKAS